MNRKRMPRRLADGSFSSTARPRRDASAVAHGHVSSYHVCCLRMSVHSSAQVRPTQAREVMGTAGGQIAGICQHTPLPSTMPQAAFVVF